MSVVDHFFIPDHADQCGPQTHEVMRLFLRKMVQQPGLFRQGVEQLPLGNVVPLDSGLYERFPGDTAVAELRRRTFSKADTSAE